MKDIRNQAHLSGSEVKKLNFIRNSDLYVFRKFYRSGLRSHIFEVVLASDVEKESSGVVQDGIRVFPRARPVKMFRIFRHRFKTQEEIFLEIKRYNTLVKYIGPKFIARSEEFIADYGQNDTGKILLCGLQEYVDGEILDPWRLSGRENVLALLSAMAHDTPKDIRAQKAFKNMAAFVRRVRNLMDQTGYIPDLAGMGNLILTPAGNVKLVDINNIVQIHQDKYIHLDDKGYPACDVSIQVLSILEQKLLEQDYTATDPLFKIFLTQDRLNQVKAIEQAFYRQLNTREN
ncbi:MAG: hypothetical protein HUK40_07005 [Desulfobacter sp.]|nr:hypothetical protein [Desulfobacter sp.]